MPDIRRARKAAGLTQIQLARRANISRQRLCYAEMGELKLRTDEVLRIRRVIEEAPRRHAERVREILEEVSI